jgi:hypothetical protein
MGPALQPMFGAGRIAVLPVESQSDPTSVTRTILGRTRMSTSPLESSSALAHAAPVTYYRTKRVDAVKIFYREAGPSDAPIVLLLHGFPTPRTCSGTLSPPWRTVTT